MLGIIIVFTLTVSHSLHNDASCRGIKKSEMTISQIHYIIRDDYLFKDKKSWQDFCQRNS